VNYAQGEHQHVQTEFAFDINEIAHHRLAPVHYLRHVGLEVPTRQLALAFYQTYGLTEDFDTRRGRRFNVRGYRFAVHNFIPRIAYAVTLLHRSHEPADIDSPELKQLEAEIADVDKANGWELYRRKPGPGTYCLAGLLFVLPKIGPLKLVAVKGPTPATEASYVHSVMHSADELNTALRRFTPPPATRASASAAAAADKHSDPPPSRPLPAKLNAAQTVPRQPIDPRHPLPNRDLDTGNTVKPSGYRLTDATYANLIHRLVANPQQAIPPGVRTDILTYYANLDLPFATKDNPQAWATLQTDLKALQTMPTSTEPVPYPTYGTDLDPDTTTAAPSPAQ
jgi:hypothetical protein